MTITKIVSHKVSDNVVMRVIKGDDITVNFTDDKGTKHSVVFEEKNAKVAFELWQVVQDLDRKKLKLNIRKEVSDGATDE